MSKKSVAQKLLIKEDYNVLLINEPNNYNEILGELPANVSFSNDPIGSFSLIQVFVTSKGELENQLEKLKPLLKIGGLLWITYPKGASELAKEVKPDINRDSILKIGRSQGLKPVSMISVDENWSAFRFKIP
jgi:hypothetical protein